MDAQPPFPRDCCRCGSHDADGDSAETGCLGKSRVAKGRRRFEFGLDRGTLDKHFTDLVHVELRADGAGLPDGVSEEQLSRQLRDEVVPVRAVDTPRVCRPCWQAAERDRLPAALQRLKQALRQPDDEEPAAESAAGAAASEAAEPQPASNAKRTWLAAFVPSPDDAPETAQARPVKRGAAAAAQPSETPEQQLIRDLKRHVAESEEKLKVANRATQKQAEKAGKWKGRHTGNRARKRPVEDENQQLKQQLAQKDAEVADLKVQLRRVENERDVALRRSERLLAELVKSGSTEDPDDADEDVGGPAPGTLDGVTLNIVGKGKSSRTRLLERYRDVLVELAELYHVAQHKVLDCLLMVLRATGLTVECSVKDSEEQFVQAVAETAELQKKELTDVITRALDPDFQAPTTDPDVAEDAPMLAHPKADKGPVESASWDSYGKDVLSKIKKWSEAEQPQEHGELTPLPCPFPVVESFAQFRARQRAGMSDRELRDMWTGGVGGQACCYGYALYADDTTKWNKRNQSAMLISGPGLTQEGKPRLFALTEIFGQGGSTGDLEEILCKFVEQRERQIAHGQHDVGRQLFVYDIVSFCCDNCASMRGHSKGLHAKIEQVRVISFIVNCCENAAAVLFSRATVLVAVL